MAPVTATWTQSGSRDTLSIASICSTGRPFSIDLFADSGNSMCPRFFAATQQGGAEATDAMAHDWSHLQRAWIFPPSDLLHLVVDKLVLDRPSGAMLIAPFLTNSRW